MSWFASQQYRGIWNRVALYQNCPLLPTIALCYSNCPQFPITAYYSPVLQQLPKIAHCTLKYCLPLSKMYYPVLKHLEHAFPPQKNKTLPCNKRTIHDSRAHVFIDSQWSDKCDHGGFKNDFSCIFFVCLLCVMWHLCVQGALIKLWY